MIKPGGAILPVILTKTINMAILSISGYASSGKNTVATIIQYSLCKSVGTATLEDVVKDYKANEWWLEEQSVWEQRSWAGKLKTIASLVTGIPVQDFEDQEFKKTNLGPEWASLKRRPGKRQDGIFPKKADMELVSMTVRDLLQKLGTDAMRNGLHENTWVNALMADYTPTQVQWADGPVGGYEDGPMPNWIITDTRFPNEARAVKDKGGIVVKVERPGVGPINDHPSEVALKDYPFDYTINNSGSLEDLVQSVKEFLASPVFATL